MLKRCERVEFGRKTKSARAQLVARAGLQWRRLVQVGVDNLETRAAVPPSPMQRIAMAAAVNGLGDADLEKLWTVALAARNF